MGLKTRHQTLSYAPDDCKPAFSSKKIKLFSYSQGTEISHFGKEQKGRPISRSSLSSAHIPKQKQKFNSINVKPVYPSYFRSSTVLLK